MKLLILITALLLVFALGLSLGHQIGANHAQAYESDENWQGVEF
jgi:hypothetical protein